MKLFDYLVCLACAWDISQGILEPDLFQLCAGAGIYFIWERFRVWEETNAE